MVYDTRNRIMERFEPFGDIKQIGDKSMLVCVKQPDVDAHIQELFYNEMGPSFISKYYKPLEFCPYLVFQTLQEREPYVKNDPDGFCAAWSCWYTDLRLLNPELSSKELVSKTLHALTISPQKLTNFIRNYSQFIVDVSKTVVHGKKKDEKMK